MTESTLFNNPEFPRKEPHIVEAQAGDDVVLYDTTSHRAFSLEPEAATVWQRCDGQTPADEVVGTDPDARNILGSLSAANLVSGMSTDVSRRRFMKATGVAVAGAVALPFLHSVVVPTAAHASSCDHEDNGYGNNGENNGVPCETGKSDEKHGLGQE